MHNDLLLPARLGLVVVRIANGDPALTPLSLRVPMDAIVFCAFDESSFLAGLLIPIVVVLVVVSVAVTLGLASSASTATSVRLRTSMLRWVRLRGSGTDVRIRENWAIHRWRELEGGGRDLNNSC